MWKAVLTLALGLGAAVADEHVETFEMDIFFPLSEGGDQQELSLNLAESEQIQEQLQLQLQEDPLFQMLMAEENALDAPEFPPQEEQLVPFEPVPLFVEELEEARRMPVPKRLEDRPDFVGGGGSLEGFPVAFEKELEFEEEGEKGAEAGAEVEEPLSCQDQMMAALSTCDGRDRCATRNLGDRLEALHGEVEEAEYSSGGLTSETCSMAVEAARARLDECAETKLCPKMVGHFLGEVAPASLPHLRGADHHHEHHEHPRPPPPMPLFAPEPHLAPEFRDVLNRLDDVNLCACGGRVGAGRFADLVFEDCGGSTWRYNLEAPLHVVILALFAGMLSAWLFAGIFGRVLTRLIANDTVRNGGSKPGCARTFCFGVIALALTLMLFQAISILCVFFGPFVIVPAGIFVIARRRRLAARRHVLAPRSSLLMATAATTDKKAKEIAPVVVQGEFVNSGPPDVVVGVPVA